MHMTNVQHYNLPQRQQIRTFCVVSLLLATSAYNRMSHVYPSTSTVHSLTVNRPSYNTQTWPIQLPCEPILFTAHTQHLSGRTRTNQAISSPDISMPSAQYRLVSRWPRSMLPFHCLPEWWLIRVPLLVHIICVHCELIVHAWFCRQNYAMQSCVDYTHITHKQIMCADESTTTKLAKGTRFLFNKHRNGASV